MTETGAPHDVRVAVLGLGAMGLPMAGRLATRFPVRAFDVDAGRRALAADAGAEAADGVAEAVRGATAVLVAVRTEEQLRGLLLGPDGAVAALEPGAVVIVTSTVGRPALEALAGPVAEAGAGVVDAPLSGGPVRAGRGDLLVLLSGAPAHVAAARPVVDALGSTVTVVGERPGDGQAVKTVNQLLCGVHIAAAAEALALARALGLEGESVLAALQSGAASSFMLGDRGPRMLQAWDDEGAEVRSRLDIFTKDLGIVGAATRSLGLPSPVAAAAEQLFLIGQARGLGSLDDSAVIRVLAEDGA